MFYGEHLADARTILRLQDADATFFAELELSDADKLQWLDQLREHTTQPAR